MGFLDLIWALVIGLVVGLIARFLLPGRDPMGCIGTSLIGVGGAFVGSLISRAIWGAPGRGEYMHPGFWISLVGAVLLLMLVRVLRRRP
jgi:uncharacterized membrane protein YeaQ/YmgE (transglycosylase-associated protein family)